jgi:hypothetical protein
MAQPLHLPEGADPAAALGSVTFSGGVRLLDWNPHVAKEPRLRSLEVAREVGGLGVAQVLVQDGEGAEGVLGHLAPQHQAEP